MLPDQPDFHVGDERLTGQFLDGEEFFQKDFPGFHGKRTKAGETVAAGFAAAVGVVGDLFEALAEIGEGFKVRVVACDEGVEGTVFIDHGAGPAAKPGGISAAAGRVGFAEDEGALLTGSLFVKRYEVPVGTSPRRAGRNKTSPDFLGSDVADRGENKAARMLVVHGEAGLQLVVVFRHALSALGGFVPADTQQEDGIAAVRDLLADETGGGTDFHAVGAPPETAVGGGVAAAKEVDPEAFLWKRLGADDLNGNVQPSDTVLDLLQQIGRESVEDGRFDESVVADDKHQAAAFVWGHVFQTLDHEVQDKSGILPAGKSDHPWPSVGLQVFRPQVPADICEFLKKVGHEAGSNAVTEHEARQQIWRLKRIKTTLLGRVNLSRLIREPGVLEKMNDFFTGNGLDVLLIGLRGGTATGVALDSTTSCPSLWSPTG